MNRQQLVIALAAVVAAVIVSSIVTWRVVRDGDERAGRPAALGAQVDQPAPGDAEEIASQKEEMRGEVPAGENPTEVGAPNPQPQAQCDPNGPPTIFASWRYTPQTLDEAERTATNIVLGEVVEVRQAQPSVFKKSQEPGGQISTPMRVVSFRVNESFKGSSRPGQVLTLIQIGDDCNRVFQDPLYETGDVALLMLRAGPRGHMQTISPEGRYTQTPDGTLDAMVDNKATEELDGTRPANVESVLD
jgi:hypothetical protein